MSQRCLTSGGDWLTLKSTNDAVGTVAAVSVTFLFGEWAFVKLVDSLRCPSSAFPEGLV